MKKEYQTLEFQHIIKKIQGYSHSELGRGEIASLKPVTDYDVLLEQQIYLQQAMSFVQQYGKIPLAHFEDITKMVQKTDKDGTLVGNELLAISYQLTNSKEIKEYTVDKGIDETLLYQYIDELYDLSSIQKEIHRCIDSSGLVSDGASSQLRKIRKSIVSMESTIRNKINQMQSMYKDCLSQETVASRNNHLVLPVKAGNKNQVKGIVHAVSSSGQTMFIEPDAVVQLNNQLFVLQNDEKKEVQRILFELSQMVKHQSEPILYNQKILVGIDVLFSKAYYTLHIDGVVPTISKTKTLSLVKARHPLIDPKSVVSNDIILKDHYEMMLISGSNTGGKTIVLKTIGLLSLMGLSGLGVPCYEATIPLFDKIFVDLGDEQSIEQSLSTFSSHMTRLVSICQQVTPTSLVLLDEIGSGTDPREGESIAQAILEYLHQNEAMTIASTHYSGLKQYAKKEDYILIAAVEFDQENMVPTYRLLTGNVGNSYAIEISRRLGLKESIIQKAYELKEENQSQSDLLLEKLENELNAVQQEKDDLHSLVNEANHKVQKYQRLVEVFEKQREDMVEQAKLDANKYLEDAKNQVNEILEDLLEKQSVKQHEFIEAKHTLDILKHEDKKVVQSTTLDHEYALGDTVLLLKMNRQGEIISMNKKGAYTIDIGGLKVNVKQNEIQFVRKKQKVKAVKSNLRSIKKSTNQSFEINVIGCRYEEAMNIVDKFLDDAIVHNYSMVRVVHGLGSGVLRKGVRKLLDKHKYVVSYRDGGPNEGGMGATLVYFE